MIEVIHFSSYITVKGTYDKDIKGSVLIRTDEVTLQNMTVDGDLIIGCGAADGKIVLDNVTVKGRLLVWGGGIKAVYCNNGTQMPEVVVARVDDAVKVIYDRDSTLAVIDTIKVRITERAKQHKETEVIFYDVSGLREAQKQLNAIVADNQIALTAPAHLLLMYRLEQEFNRQGLKLSRQTMANWLLKASEKWLRPVYDVLHEQLCREPVLHADETTLQVLKEPGRSSTSKSYMWLYRTSGCAKQAVVLYEYQPTRKAEHAEAFLKGFSVWLHADGYQGYHRLPGNIRVVGCWAHARRKFDEALSTLPQEKRKDSPAAMGEWYCSQLFKLEQALAELTPEERYEKRLEQEKPVLDALLSWANEMQAKTAPKSALGKAIHYLLEQWPYLTRYLEDGRLELSNNRAERSMKPFVMGRKNWLFANTPGGAQASSVIYSLIETAKENGLDPYRYLLWVLQNAPQLSGTNKAWAEKLLPANAPEECYIPQK